MLLWGLGLTGYCCILKLISQYFLVEDLYLFFVKAEAWSKRGEHSSGKILEDVRICG
jgi:hypothetical protein